MKFGNHKMFWLGVGFALVGIVLMSLPEKPCVDCDDEADGIDAIYKVTDSEADLAPDQHND